MQYAFWEWGLTYICNVVSHCDQNYEAEQNHKPEDRTTKLHFDEEEKKKMRWCKRPPVMLFKCSMCFTWVCCRWGCWGWQGWTKVEARSTPCSCRSCISGVNNQFIRVVHSLSSEQEILLFKPCSSACLFWGPCQWRWGKVLPRSSSQNCSSSTNTSRSPYPGKSIPFWRCNFYKPIMRSTRGEPFIGTAGMV